MPAKSEAAAPQNSESIRVLRPDGAQCVYGTAGEVAEALSLGRLPHGCRFWTAGMQRWLPLSEMFNPKGTSGPPPVPAEMQAVPMNVSAPQMGAGGVGQQPGMTWALKPPFPSWTNKLTAVVFGAWTAISFVLWVWLANSSVNAHSNCIISRGVGSPCESADSLSASSEFFLLMFLLGFALLIVVPIVLNLINRRRVEAAAQYGLMAR
jgi:hypothetical protein